jgi:hypothetical protein
MTSTNRFLNRALIFLIGLILLAAGAAVAVGALLPDLQVPISQAAEDATAPTTDALSSQPWILWVAAAVCLVLIILLLAFIVRQGGGRTSTMLRVDESRSANTPTGGRLTLEAKVAAQVLEETLSRDSDIVSIDVVAFRVRRQNVLRITAQARRGASPVTIRRTIDRAVADWDAVLGTEVPVVIQIVGGLRTQLTSTTRVA